MKAPAFLAAAALAVSALNAPAVAAESVFDAPAAEREAKEGAGLKTAIFAGGCFWGVEAVFSHMKGVKSAISGYHGGDADTARYDIVSRGQTDHAEAVKIVYDPSVVRYDQLLRVFFSVVADPTLKDRQGPDRGPQYRAALVPLSKEQRAVAQSYLQQMKKSGVWSKPIVTGIESARTFYPAEKYHQDFAEKNPNHPYIRRWDAPKVEALREMFPSFYSGSFQKG
ncbi:peptide-methionine (S)-S-oxide reductase [Altererythrobacter atlanticus]|uniref:Peptide methionine sulfoxide reductase MsrA n=1 Tax=Croceibacterium atlanticum TaxID=1267766 RepID=A0A0F7KRX5_9SPHN|nr:peptide-methionine (S)-S-oxide reductase MsrA [Croceibacterium atlanticum]AKH43208.1 Peptide methionine sulfoxide reductase MsrA [Croceibacterium atlanticum]MBB5732087.1 peptide-methionine (S)-S-oxide reductase [Croceibacterium atlanticum]